MTDNEKDKTIKEVKRILNLGKLLSSVLTPEEQKALSDQAMMGRNPTGETIQYVSSSTLDEETETVQ